MPSPWRSRKTRDEPLESRRDDAGNRYEPRRLASGERFEIIKNFYSPARLRELLTPHARDLVYEELDALWLVRYRAA